MFSLTSKPDFQVVPAIDIMSGVCLRLVRGRAEDIATQAGDPVEVAKRFAEGGASSLHVVDLDGAFAGQPVSLPLVEKIATATGLPVEVGGGLRSSEDVQRAFDSGATWVILGSKAVREPSWLAAMATRYPGHVLLGLDLTRGSLAVDGWKGAVGTEPSEVLQKAWSAAAATASDTHPDAVLPLAGVVITDTSRDGTLGGIDLDGLARVLRLVSPYFPKGGRLLGAGGVSGRKDLDALATLMSLGLSGAVVGRAFYDGELSKAKR